MGNEKTVVRLFSIRKPQTPVCNSYIVKKELFNLFSLVCGWMKLLC